MPVVPVDVPIHSSKFNLAYIAASGKPLLPAEFEPLTTPTPAFTAAVAAYASGVPSAPGTSALYTPPPKMNLPFSFRQFTGNAKERRRFRATVANDIANNRTPVANLVPVDVVRAALKAHRESGKLRAPFLFSYDRVCVGLVHVHSCD
jgi:hypothetical protein